MTKKRDLKPVARVADILPEIRLLIESSRYRVTATANLELVSLYWNIGRVITEDVQKHVKRAEYGTELIEGLAEDLTQQYGRGFSATNLWDTRRFFESFVIPRTSSGESLEVRQIQMTSGVARQTNRILQTTSEESAVRIEVDFNKHHHIGWSHYVLLMGESDPVRRRFYFNQAASQRWPTRELRKQMRSALFERVALSKNTLKLAAVEKQKLQEVAHYEDAFKDPYVLDFLELEGAFSEKDLESRIIHNLQKFLSELGNDFCFITSQFRMRIDADDYFLDLLFYHRGLRCLVAVDLKIGAFTAADKGQMDLYLSWLKQNEWRDMENEPVGLILCTSKKKQHVELLLSHGPHKMQVSEYLMKLPDKTVLEQRLRYYSQLLQEGGSKT